MKLALLTQHYAPHFEGGTEVVVRAQARELRQRGCDVRVISGTDRLHTGQDVEMERVDGIPVAFLPRRPDEFYDLLLARPRVEALAREIAATCDLAHVHHWSTLTRSIVRSLAREIPVVVTLHDLFVTCPRFFRKPQHGIEECPVRGEFETCTRCVAPDVPTIPIPSVHEGLRQRAEHFQAEIDAARVVVMPSAAHRDRVAHWVDLPSDRVVIIPHGLCHATAVTDGSAAPSRTWTGAGKLRVLFMGHRTRVKGVLDLVAALAALPQAERERVEFITLGDELEAGFDEELRAAAGSLDIRHHGTYDLASLPQRLAEIGGAHLAALPSRVEESYGLVVDEAQAMGLPVWVSDRGAPPERVGAGGRVLPAEDPAVWTRAFAAVLADPASLARERSAVPTQVRNAADAANELYTLYAELLTPAP